MRLLFSLLSSVPGFHSGFFSRLIFFFFLGSLLLLKNLFNLSINFSLHITQTDFCDLITAFFFFLVSLFLTTA